MFKTLAIKEFKSFSLHKKLFFDSVGRLKYVLLYKKETFNQLNKL